MSASAYRSPYGPSRTGGYATYSLSDRRGVLQLVDADEVEIAERGP